MKLLKGYKLYRKLESYSNSFTFFKFIFYFIFTFYFLI